MIKTAEKQKPVDQMSDEVLRLHIKSYIASQPIQEVGFTWQGVEPTMAGWPFFEKTLTYQARFNQGKKIRNNLPFIR